MAGTPSNMGGPEKSQINGNCLLLGELRAFSMVVVPILPVMLSNTELHTTDTGLKKTESFEATIYMTAFGEYWNQTNINLSFENYTVIKMFLSKQI